MTDLWTYEGAVRGFLSSDACLLALARALVQNEPWAGVDEEYDFGDFVNLTTAREYASQLLILLGNGSPFPPEGGAR